ncbi:hypothetical protein [Alteribacillus sp. HJP-4]|uniref:hypothetical protein n=1 Tax=Alteribacillus sp. HJP-4 TaxID=2775394 RepID=UPI0035CD1BD2
MGIFNFKFSKEVEQTDLLSKKNELQAQLQEVSTKIQRTKDAIRLAETESMLDGTATVQKKLAKFQSGLEKLQKEQEKLNKEAAKVNEQVSQLNLEKGEEEIEAILQSDIEQYGRSQRGLKLKEQLNNFIDYELDALSGIDDIRVASGRPQRLLNKVRAKGYFSKEDVTQLKLKEMWEQATAEEDKDIEKDVQEIVNKLRKMFD